MNYVQLLFKQLSDFLTGVIQKTPDFSLVFLTVAFLLTVGVTIKALDPGFLVLDGWQIAHKYQLHRVVTSFLFWGPLSLNWLLFVLTNCVRLIQVERQLNRRAFAVTMTSTVVQCLAVGLGLKMPYPSMLFFNAITFLWSRLNPNAQVMVMMIVPIQAQYYPFINLLIAVLQKQSILVPILGILVGAASWLLITKEPARRLFKIQ